MNKNYILTKEVAEKKMRRMAYEIIENNFGETHFTIAGIRESGRTIARRIAAILREISGATVDLIEIVLDKKIPRDVLVDPVTDFNGKTVILVDDVSNSGRTLLYASKPLLAALPKTVQTLVLVERKHSAFPVKPDYVGLSVATTLQEHIYVDSDEENVAGAWLE